MKAIEITGKVDEADVEEREWLRAVASNPAFDFLQDEKEDVYGKETIDSPNNGKPSR